MPSYAPVSRERHRHKRWRRCDSYAFVAGETVAPIVAAELGRAALFMPLAFVKQADRFSLVAVLSVAPGRNLFVAPDGRWLGPHIPMLLRTYPFRLLSQQGTDNLVLCVDEQSTSLFDDGADGEPLFEADGNLSPALQQVLEVLTAVERSRAGTDLVVAELGAAGVIMPWEIKLRSTDREQMVAGLYRIDEAALQVLSDAAFLKLRQTSALPLAYAQLLSAGQLYVLEHLARVQQQLTPAQTAAPAIPESLDSVFGIFSCDEGVIRFE
jgi:SapC